MAKTPKIDHYRVTLSLEDGTFTTRDDVSGDVPLKGESFEYEHTERRIGQVHKVEAVYDDDTVAVLTELSDTHHALEDSPVTDDVPDPAELTHDPVDEDNPPSEGALEPGASMGEPA